MFDIPGELGLVSGERTIDWVERHAPEASVGFGLGGPEMGVPRPQFEHVFARARAIGLAQQAITLEVCPTSNLRTRAVAAIEQHPLPLLLAAGVPVTLGSDDPGMFDTTLVQEYRLAGEVLGVSRDGLVDIARTGIRSSFADAATKQRLLTELDAYAGSRGGDSQDSAGISTDSS